MAESIDTLTHTHTRYIVYLSKVEHLKMSSKN